MSRSTTWWRTGWIVGLLLLAGAAAARPPPPPAVMARAQLRGGMPVMAARSARDCLAVAPDDAGCLAVLGRAAATIGDCDEALRVLAELRATGAWGGPTAEAEAICHVREGRLHQALVVLDEAEALDPDRWMVALHQGLIRARLGDADGVDAAWDRLLDTGADDWAVQLVELWRAALDGPDRVDVAVWWLYRELDAIEREVVVHLSVVDCERWLAVGAPADALAASDLGLAASRGHQRVRSCRAEARRRLGEPERVLFDTARPWDAWRAESSLVAVRARALVDLDRVDEARFALDELGPVDLPEVWVSRWYVARAWGDVRGMARWARRLASVGPRALDELDQLDPIDRVAP